MAMDHWSPAAVLVPLFILLLTPLFFLFVHGISKQSQHSALSDDYCESLLWTDIPDSDVNAIVAYLAKNFPIVKINVNKAAAKDIEAGLELTSKEAEAIVQYRETKGNFKSLDDLKRVPGLDAAKIESKRDQLEF